jgi:glycosyltransferase involved in cell wall biosynthesis
VYAADFEAGVAALLSGKRFLYDVLDTYADRYIVPRPVQWFLRLAESFVYTKAAYKVHVASYREKTLRDFGIGGRSCIVVPNTPMRSDLPALAAEKVFDVIVTGNIDKNRGCDLLLDACKGLGLTVCAAGKVSSDILAELEAEENFSYFGYVSSSTALRLCASSRAIFCAYDPRIPINRMAAPNKVFDALFCATPLIINSEILISRWAIRQGVGEPFEWSDAASLERALLKIKEPVWNDRIAAARSAAASMQLWDEAFLPVSCWLQQTTGQH